jgi:non-specific serine/threonine protein kinase
MSDGESQPGQPLFTPLTRREQEVLELLAQEQSASEIAHGLTLAVSSVKGYIQHLYGKLGVSSRREAIARARELGLVEAPAARTALPVVAPPPTPERKHNLPIQVNRFFGREDAIEQLKQRLAEYRLVTLTGSGGVGKTRLSLETASQLVDKFSDGVWLVELAPIADPALVPQHVAAVLGVRQSPGRSVLDSLLGFLRARQLLLVLDNCEHLLEACAQLVETLLRDSPGLKVLASSREPLGIAGEAVFGVRSLTFPDPAHLPPIEKLSEYTALSLFVDRARLVVPDYQITEHNAAAIARICQRLDGIPLAIEMAAARVNVLSAANLADRLENSFRVLTGASRTALPRQQTLRAMIDWSYELLGEEERRLLQRLSVFAGGCALEAVEVICADAAESEAEAGPEPAEPKIGSLEIIEVLASLISKSMVMAERGPGEETRYRLLEIVRQYAREKLYAAGEGDSVRSRHLRFFVQLAEEARPELHGPDQLAWLDRLELDLDNFRAALDYSQSDRTGAEAEAGLRLIVALSTFWDVRGYRREVEAWLEAGLALESVPRQSLVRAEALRMAAQLFTGDKAVNRQRAEESVAIFRQAGAAGRRGLAYALITLGDMAHAANDFAPLVPMVEESIRLFRAVGDKWGLAWALHNLAQTLDPLVNYLPRPQPGAPAPLPNLPPAARNDHTAERDLFEESLALFRETGDRRAQLFDLGAMGAMHFCWGHRAEAQANFSEILPIGRELGDMSSVADSLVHLARDAVAHDELDRATALLDEVAAIERSLYSDSSGYRGDFIRAEIARRTGAYEQAGEFLARARARREESGNPDLVAAAMDGQARVARSQGDRATAHALHHQALVMRRQAGHPISLAHSFHALALLAADREDWAERSARLLGAAQPYGAALYAFWSNLPIWRAEHNRALSAVRKYLGKTRAAALIAEGEAMTLEQAYNYALTT